MKKYNVHDYYQVFNTYRCNTFIGLIARKICFKVLISINMYKLNEIHDNMIIDK